MNIFIITEGSNTGGTGHLTRCISLYQAFEEKGITPEFIVNGDATAADLLRGKKHTIFNWLKEKERLFDMVRGADITIIDSYMADRDIYEEISRLTSTPVYLDDNNRLDYPDGIVINGTIGAERSDQTTKKEITRLLGTRYIPLSNSMERVDELLAEVEKNNIIAMVGYNQRFTAGIQELKKNIKKEL